MTIRPLIPVMLAALILACASSLYVIWYRAVQAESATAASLAAERDVQEQNALQAKSQKGELSRIETDETLIRGYFVDTSDIVTFLESLQSTGQQSGATVEVVSVTEESGKPHDQLNLYLRITGSFNAVERTLGSLEYGSYDITLASLTFDTSDPGKTAAQWTAAATFKVGTRITHAASSSTP